MSDDNQAMGEPAVWAQDQLRELKFKLELQD